MARSTGRPGAPRSRAHPHPPSARLYSGSNVWTIEWRVVGLTSSKHGEEEVGQEQTWVPELIELSAARIKKSVRGENHA